MSAENPIYGPFFGVMGAASAIIFSGMHSMFLSFVLLEMAVWLVIDLSDRPPDSLVSRFIAMFWCMLCGLNDEFQRKRETSNVIFGILNIGIAAASHYIHTMTSIEAEINDI